MTQSIKLDIDGTSGLWLLPFAKRQLARFKTLLPFGKRRFNLPAGEEVTIWWGQMNDRIRIVAKKMMSCRVDGGTSSSAGLNARRIIRMLGDVVAEIKLSEQQIGPTFSTPFFDFSKHGTTVVELGHVSGAMLLTKAGSVTSVPNIAQYPVVLSPLSDMFSFVSNYFGISLPWHSLNQAGGISPAAVSISADGETIVAISSISTESAVVSTWDALNLVFNTRRVNLPPRVSELLNPLLTVGTILGGTIRNGTLFNSPLFAPYPSGFAASHAVGVQYFLHPLSTARLYAAYQVGTHTTVTSTNLGGGVIQYRFAGTAQVGITVYDTVLNTWEVIQEQEIPFAVHARSDTGAISGQDPNEFADRTCLMYHNDGGASIARIQAVDPTVKSIRSFGVTHPADTLPLLDMVSLSADSNLIFAMVGEGGLREAVIGGASIFWRWGLGGSDTVSLPWGPQLPILSRSGRWLVIPLGSFPGTGIRVYHDGVQVWDSASLASQYSIVASDQPSYDHDGSLVVKLTAMGTGVLSRQFISFVPDGNGVYQAVFGDIVPPTLFTFPNPFIIPDECVGGV
jgi:hypothetical protein